MPIKPTSEWYARYAGEQFDDDPARDLSYKKYAAYTSHMDHGVGQLLDSLEMTSQREEYPRLGSNLPFRGVKAQLYEGGIRTPTIVNWQGVLSQGVREDPVQVVDWMPTLISMLNLQPQQDHRFDGTDIWPLISAGEPAADRDLFWNFRGDVSLGMRHGDWKLISSAGEGERKLELFNIADDPSEEVDLAQDREDVVAELVDLIEQERRADGSSARTDVTSYDDL